MKLIYFFLLNVVSCLNLNSLSQISRKELLNSFSQLTLLKPLLIKNDINKINNYENVLEETIKNEDLQEKEDILINTFDYDIYFYSPITKYSCFELETNLLILDNKSQMLKNKYNIDTGPINLHIQSNGGSLFHSIYIVDLIQNLETPVYTYIDGFAASAATLISVSGKKRYMSKNSLMLIHQLSGGVNGKFFEIKDESENLDGLMNFIIKTYLENSKMEEDNLREILKRDIWLNASYCLKNGLVDGIL